RRCESIDCVCKLLISQHPERTSARRDSSPLEDAVDVDPWPDASLRPPSDETVRPTSRKLPSHKPGGNSVMSRQGWPKLTDCCGRPSQRIVDQGRTNRSADD